jgi:hypothetical protein
MSTLQFLTLPWLVGLSILASVVCIDMTLEARRVIPTTIFLVVTGAGWLVGRVHRLNRANVWPVVLAVGLWTYPLVPEAYQKVVALALPCLTLVALALPRIGERSVLFMLIGCAGTIFVAATFNQYYLSSQLLFLAGMWCLLIGNGLFDRGRADGTTTSQGTTA